MKFEPDEVLGEILKGIDPGQSVWKYLLKVVGDMIRHELQHKGEVKLPGFGKFYVTHSATCLDHPQADAAFLNTHILMKKLQRLECARDSVILEIEEICHDVLGDRYDDVPALDDDVSQGLLVVYLNCDPDQVDNQELHRIGHLTGFRKIIVRQYGCAGYKQVNL